MNTEVRQSLIADSFGVVVFMVLNAVFLVGLSVVV